ncbi:MAG: MFS transporter [Sphingomonadales bacterium]|nr:MFS transporter [Sphingomonadales bacterium]MBD3773046.1 MFS transporter [Paracoccaceae bacterium]
MSLLDRQILAILAPDIKADLAIGDAEMGLLYGTVFALFYALFSLPVGRLADGWLRTRLLGICLVLWSAATGLAGLASSFGLLALSRLGVGIGEAATQPAGTSLVYDYWPRHRRGFVMAVMAAAIAAGLGGSMLLGGVVAQWWKDTFPAGDAPLGLAGWQFAFFVAAAPGFLLALFVYRMKEPPRGTMDGIETPDDPAPFAASTQVLGAILPGTNWLNLARLKASGSVWRANLAVLVAIIAAMAVLVRLASDFSPRPDLALLGISISPHALQWGVIGFGIFVIFNLFQSMKLTDPQAHRVITRSPTLLLTMAAGALQSVINYGIMGFTPLFLISTYQLSMADVAIVFGLLSAAIGIVGPMISGPLADRMQRRFPGKGRAYVALFAMGLSPLISLWVYSAPDPTQFYIRFTIYSVILTGWLPPLYSIMYEQVLPRMRGITTSVYLMAMTILGLGTGPYLVGLVSDATGNLGLAIKSINLVGPVIVVLLLVVARRANRDEEALMERAAE